jgi:hypothetical protein
MAIVPGCSTTNIEVGSLGRQAMSRGLSSPRMSGSIDRFGGAAAGTGDTALSDGDGADGDGWLGSGALLDGAGVTVWFPHATRTSSSVIEPKAKLRMAPGCYPGSRRRAGCYAPGEAEPRAGSSEE